MSIKVFIVGRQIDYACWFTHTLVNDIKECDLVLFTGGEDVSSFLYGQRPHKATSSNYNRDLVETAAWKVAVEHKKKLLGICRGSQLMCAMAGGILVQNQENPSYFHHIETADGKKLLVNSTHHQAQYPWGLPKEEYNILGWSKGISRFHSGQTVGDELVVGVIPENKEVEICHYPKYDALAIQCHPESMSDREHLNQDIAKSMTWLRTLLQKHMNNQLAT